MSQAAEPQLLAKAHGAKRPSLATVKFDTRKSSSNATSRVHVPGFRESADACQDSRFSSLHAQFPPCWRRWNAARPRKKD